MNYMPNDTLIQMMQNLKIAEAHLGSELTFNSGIQLCIELTEKYHSPSEISLIDEESFGENVYRELQYSLGTRDYDAKAITSQIIGLVKKHLSVRECSEIPSDETLARTMAGAVLRHENPVLCSKHSCRSVAFSAGFGTIYCHPGQ